MQIVCAAEYDEQLELSPLDQGHFASEMEEEKSATGLMCPDQECEREMKAVNTCDVFFFFFCSFPFIIGYYLFMFNYYIE